MAYVAFEGPGPYIPRITGASIQYSFSTSAVISGANASDKIACVGRVQLPGKTGTKTITKVGFRFGSITKTNGSTVRVSLQDVDLTAGPPVRPDGVVDQSVTIANADAGFANNSWYLATLGASRTVTHGEYLAVVFDWASAVTGDSLMISGLGVSSATNNAGSVNQNNCVSLFTGAAWAVQNMITNIVFEFSDGTFGSFGNSFVISAFNSHAINTGTTPDEIGLEFQVPFNCEIDGFMGTVSIASGADFSMILYDAANTALVTVAVDANAVQAHGSARFISLSFPKIALTANTTYRLVYKPTTTNSVTVYSRDYAVAGHRAITELGLNKVYTARTDAGAWDSSITTRQTIASIRVCSIDIPSGGGGGSGTAPFVYNI